MCYPITLTFSFIDQAKVLRHTGYRPEDQSAIGSVRGRHPDHGAEGISLDAQAVRIRAYWIMCGLMYTKSVVDPVVLGHTRLSEWAEPARYCLPVLLWSLPASVVLREYGQRLNGLSGRCFVCRCSCMNFLTSYGAAWRYAFGV